MAEGETQVHPGSFVGDSIEEFKKLPVWGKFLAVGALGLVIYLAIRARQNAAASQTAQGAAGSALGGATGSAGAGQSPFSSVNGLPLLPGNVNPVYSPNGDLVGYQQGATPSTTPTAPTPSTGGTPSGGTGKASDPTWYYQKGGVTYHAWHGADGRIWGNTGPNTPQVLLSGPAPTPSKTPVPKKAGSDAPLYKFPMLDMMHNPLVYWASATPHKPSTTP